MDKILFDKGKTDDWTTPDWVYDKLNEEFCFTLDPCASDKNHKCEKYFTEEQDGLSKNWGGNECSAIRLIRKLLSGLRSAMTRDVRTIPLW